MESPYTVLLEKFREAKSAAEMKQEELANAMGMRQSTISDILSGKKRMGNKSLGGVLLVFPNLRPYVIAVMTARPKRDAA